MFARPFARRSGAAIALLAALVVAGCSWDAAAARRYAVYRATLTEAIASISAKKEACADLKNAAQKEKCYAILDAELHKLLSDAAQLDAAIAACNENAVRALVERIEGALSRAATLTGNFPSGRNFADRLNNAPIQVQIQSQQVAQMGTVHTYQVMPGSQVTTSFDGGITFENYPAAGQIVLDVNVGPTFAHCTLIDMDIVLDFADVGPLHITDPPGIDVVFDLVPNPMGGAGGVMAGWLDYALENWTLAGQYSTVLNVNLSPNFQQLTFITPPAATSVNVFPEDPAPTGPYIYYFGPTTGIRVGGDATLTVRGVEPGATVDFFHAPSLVQPGGALGGSAWDLNQKRQAPAGAATADANGEVVFNFQVPNRPGVTGKTVFFQGLAHESGGSRSTIAFSAPILH